MTVTDTAIKKIKEMQVDEMSLRITVRGGGCSGFQYQLLWDSEKPEDIVYGDVIIDRNSHIYLMGSEVDYVDELNQSGFKINNPNAKTTCGCGESFTV
jgi:iron-sulfur cluster assembly accessory protein